MSFDHSLVFWLNFDVLGMSTSLNSTVVFFAVYFPYVVALLFVFFAFRQWPLAYQRLVLVAEGISAGIAARIGVEIIRLFIPRLRPLVVDHIAHVLFIETSYSFPSGHASFFFALSTIVYFYNKRWGFWFFIASASIGFARVVAGVHYPTDILGGMILGIAVGWGIHWCFKNPQVFKVRKELSPSSLGKRGW